jgi:hypothetical protein
MDTGNSNQKRTPDMVFGLISVVVAAFVALVLRGLLG